MASSQRFFNQQPAGPAAAAENREFHKGQVPEVIVLAGVWSGGRQADQRPPSRMRQAADRHQELNKLRPERAVGLGGLGQMLDSGAQFAGQIVVEMID
jgi:hypothetical protein